MTKEEQNIPSVDVDVDEGMSVDEALAKVAMLLAKVQEPKVLSDVSEREIIHCASLFVVANKMKDTMLADFLQSFLMLRVSKQRKGREELLQIARSAKESSEGRVSRLKTFLTGVR